MLIDWFTVGAQAVNFLVLLWLMKRYLYKPILNAIDAREKRVADELSDVARQVADADRTRRELEHRSLAFATDKAALLAVAVTGAAAEHDCLIAAARTEGDALRLKQLTVLREQKSADAARLRTLVIDEVFSISRRALGDLADAQLESCLVAAFVSRLRELPPAEKKLWVAAVAAPKVEGEVRSRFELGPLLRDQIRAAVAELCTVSVPLSFVTATDLIGGIDLTANGRRVSWNLADYLQTLERRVATL